jgi:hypothetical protein
MLRRTIACLGLIAPLAIGCTADDNEHAVAMTASLTTGADGKLAFLSPSASIATHVPADVAGKPYYVGVFPAGFSPGNDPALFQRWGTVPASLMIREASPAQLAPGPYDMVLVIYASSPISAAMLAFEESPPAAKGGDLSSFTLSAADVRPGDPDQALGTIRMNVDDADVDVAITNRTPMDLSDRDQTAAAFEHTILFIP